MKPHAFSQGGAWVSKQGTVFSLVLRVHRLGPGAAGSPYCWVKADPTRADKCHSALLVPGTRNKLNTFTWVSFLSSALSSHISFPSFAYNNNKHTSRNPSEFPPTVVVNSSAKLNINFAFALLCSHPPAYLLSPVLVQVPMAVSPQDCAHAPGSGT